MLKICFLNIANNKYNNKHIYKILSINIFYFYYNFKVLKILIGFFYFFKYLTFFYSEYVTKLIKQHV